MTMAQEPALPALRVLITKIGLDGHDRGSRIVAGYLRDAGMEVVYTPPWQTIESVVNIARQEDVDVIGLSSLATDHLIIPDLLKAMKAEGLADVPVVVGGIIPQKEVQGILDAGVRQVFGPGSMPKDIVRNIEALGLAARKNKEAQWEDGL